MNTTLKYLINATIPIKYGLALRRWYKERKGIQDPEISFAMNAISQKRRFIDIGANIGMYSYCLSSQYEHVESFEPDTKITNMLKATQLKNVRIHHTALSKKTGTKTLYIPIENGELNISRASLEKHPVACETREINTKTLDSFNFVDVDLIKIDVEGHELDVILGARKTIKKYKPILIIEIEQRHIKHDIRDVFEYICDLGYSAHFLNAKKLNSINQFSYTENQEPYLHNVDQKSYINNFIFLPS